MPTYEIKGEITDFDAFQEYPVILQNMNSLKDDILSKMMREFTFDKTGFLGSKMYITEKIESDQKEHNKTYLEYPTCIYTIIEDGRYQNGEEDIKVEIFNSILNWATEQELDPEGVAFANTRLVSYLNNMERVFLEIFIPVKK